VGFQKTAAALDRGTKEQRFISPHGTGKIIHVNPTGGVFILGGIWITSY
jgi:hypothetical protein